MSRNRCPPTSRSEPSSQFAAQVERTAPAGVHSPRKGLIGASNQLHRTPMVMVVSASGERTIYPVDGDMTPTTSKNTNPFVNKQKDTNVTAEEAPHKYPASKQLTYQPRRKRLLTREHRKSSKIISTQRNSARTALRAIAQRTAASQTDPELSTVSWTPESVGDTGAPRRRIEPFARCCDGEIKFAGGEIALRKNKIHATRCENLLNQFMPESLKMLTSFALLIIFIFWITSVILEMDVPADLFRMAANYLRSFTWGHYRKQPQSNVEKCLAYVTNLFK